MATGGPQPLKALPLGLLLALQLAAPAARAEPILHEYVVPRSQLESTRWVRDRELPAEIRTPTDEPLRQPSFDRATEAPVVGRDAATERRSSIAPDRTTTHDGQLRYGATFNPSVVPFKRVSAADQVRPDFTLGVRDRGLRPWQVTHRAIAPDRDAFWGTLQLDVKAGVPLPIPSVAPSAAILSYRTQPATTLSFFRDSADNFWVKSDKSGRFALVFLTDAPHGYFSPQLPAESASVDVPPQMKPRLPPAARAAARRVLEHIGVRRGPLGRQLARLVAYFRNFHPAPLERTSDNIYLDIALSQRGVCRHRSLAFVITAQALGVPARYVENEAHAFVEVYLPRQGWARIDLGGASIGLDVQAARDKALHRPDQDPFPRPSRFEGGYSQLHGAVSGLRPSRPGSRRATRTPQRSLRHFDRSARTPVSRSRESGDSGATGASGAAAGAANGPPRPGESPGDPSAAPLLPATSPEEPAKAPTLISVSCDQRSLYRGEKLHVWGRIHAAKAGGGNLRVEIYLGRDAESALLLGTTISDPKGGFVLHPSIPVDVEVGRYRVYAATPGDSRREASLSR